MIGRQTKERKDQYNNNVWRKKNCHRQNIINKHFFSLHSLIRIVLRMTMVQSAQRLQDRQPRQPTEKKIAHIAFGDLSAGGERVER